VYKNLSPASQTRLVLFELLLCCAIPALLAFAPSLPVDISPLVVPLLAVWGCSYALPFYLPPGEFALKIGGKTAAALFTNLFDAGGFTLCFFWNSWASKETKGGDFTSVLLSQALFGGLSMLCMPLCMARANARELESKKAK